MHFVVFNMILSTKRDPMFVLIIVAAIIFLVASTVAILYAVKKANKRKEKIKLFKKMGYDKIGYA